MKNIQTPRIIKLPEVAARTALSRSSIYALIQRGKFPKQIQLGSPRAVGWEEARVSEWIESRIMSSLSAGDES